MKLRHALAGTVALPLAIAVAGSAQANVTIFENDTTEVYNYGRIQLHLENQDGDNSIENGFSRLGFGGSTQLTNGLTGFGNVEFRFDPTEENTNPKQVRNSYVGVQGDFGKVTFGNFDSVIYTNVSSVADIAYGSGTAFTFVNGGGVNGQGNAVAFETNDLDGFTAGIGVQHTADDGNGQDEEFNVQLWAKYQINPDLSVAFGFDQNNEDGAGAFSDGEPIIAANVVFSGIENTVVGGLFETTEVNDEQLIHLGALGSYNYGQGNVYGIVSFLDWDSGEENGVQFMAGADHHLSDNFLVFGEVAVFANEDVPVAGADNDQTNIAVGARFAW